MKSLRRPSNQTISTWLKTIRPTSAAGPPDSFSGFYEDEYRIRIGTGRRCYVAACHAIQAWQMFPSQMATLVPESVPIAEGAIVSVVFRAGPLWTVNPCCITDIIEEKSADKESFGFAYSTLPGHVESGREQFLIEYDNSDNSVWYSIHVYSRPAWSPVWLVLPYARHQQRKFRQLSGEKLIAEINRRLGHDQTV